jgi:corrinoid protein of di/trimethylamine methyltransferase
LRQELICRASGLTGPDPLFAAILRGDEKRAAAITAEALSGGADPAELVSRHMIPAMDEVGRRFECQECFVPELLISGRAMKAALVLVRPLLAAQQAELAGTIVIGTVQGDLHDIGKNLVAAVLEGGGFQVHDLGVDVPPSRFVKAIQRHSPDIVAISALLTVTMPAMKSTIDALRRAQLRDSVKVIVGGAPVTRQFADQIGADGYSDNAFGAVRLARSLMENARDAVSSSCHN